MPLVKARSIMCVIVVFKNSGIAAGDYKIKGCFLDMDKINPTKII